jgi:hypothetical protein
MARGVDFYKERVYLADLNRRSAHFRFGAHAPTGRRTSRSWS